MGSATQSIYGMHAVRVMLERFPERVHRVRLAAGRDDPRGRSLSELAQRQGRPLERVDAQALQRLVGDVAHQGVVADITPLAPWNEDQLLDALQGAQVPLLLALDGVQDPHNLGACLRTADACGALAGIVPRDRAAQLTATVRKVAVGAAETTPVASVTNLVRTLKLLKQAGLWVIGADAAGAERAQDVDLKGPLVLVLGAEGTGLRRLTQENCDALVRLPQLGAVESLNVSVAAGMLLYEAVRQRASHEL
ncbi:MAG TPA: 23S rRNA (guanosine(2251)-2'-O)-methyltransferase RlmB [Candidatus Dormibacteraeota bacterium]|nr:23S rRNA (guanosine(2251)-2'-O)-methyltransferase RlmB [Candidatus Dormibacteraeota bacterium]